MLWRRQQNNIMMISLLLMMTTTIPPLHVVQQQQRGRQMAERLPSSCYDWHQLVLPTHIVSIQLFTYVTLSFRGTVVQVHFSRYKSG